MFQRIETTKAPEGAFVYRNSYQFLTAELSSHKRSERAQASCLASQSLLDLSVGQELFKPGLV